MSRTRIRGVELAGIKLAIEVPGSMDWEWSDPAIDPFVSAPHAHDLYIGVRVGETEMPECDGIVYVSGGSTFEVGRVDDDWIIAVHGAERCERVARFDSGFREGEIVVAPELARRRQCPLDHPLGELAVLHRVIREGGLVLQGSAQLVGDRAAVLVGGGRSESRQLLAGSRVVLAPGDLGFRVMGTPWHSAGPFSEPRYAELDSIHCLKTAQEFGALSLAPDDAAAELLEHAFAPVHDPGGAARLAETATRVAETAQVFRIASPPEQEVVSFDWGQHHAARGFALPTP